MDNENNTPEKPATYYGMVLFYHFLTYFTVFIVAIVALLCSLVNPLIGMGGVAMIGYFIVYRHGENLRLCKRRWATGSDIDEEAPYYEVLEKYPKPPNPMPEGFRMCNKPYCGCLINMNKPWWAPEHRCCIISRLITPEKKK